MNFLLDANLPRSALQAFTDAGHQAWSVRDIGLGKATDQEIDRTAQERGWILVTRDLDFADTRQYPPETAPGRLVLRCEDTSTAEDIVALLRRFLLMPDLIARLPGHLGILDHHRIRFRPPVNHPDES